VQTNFFCPPSSQSKDDTDPLTPTRTGMTNTIEEKKKRAKMEEDIAKQQK